jgi:alpha-amylase
MRQATCGWLDAASGATAAFDFTTKAVLQEAVSKVEYWRLADKVGRCRFTTG